VLTVVRSTNCDDSVSSSVGPATSAPSVPRRTRRFNSRDNPYIFGDTLKRIVRTDPLTYDRLVGKDRMTTGQAA